MGRVTLYSFFICGIICTSFANTKSARHGFAKSYDVEDRFTDCGTVHKSYDFVGAISMEFLLHPTTEYKKPICESTATVTNPANGQQITVAVRDYCDDCTVNDIGLSEGAFYALGGDSNEENFRVIWDINTDSDNNDEENQQYVAEIADKSTGEEISSNYAITFFQSVFQSISSVFF